MSSVDTYVYQVRAFAGEEEGSPSNETAPVKPTLGEGETTLTITLNRSARGQGIITSNPTGINCVQRAETNPGACSFDFDTGRTVVLTATPDPGSQFIGWEGACTGNEPCSLVMNASQNVTATFEPIANRIIVTKPGDGQGLVTSDTTDAFRIDCGSICEATSEVRTIYTLRAAADPGSRFAGWANCDSVRTDNRCVITIGEGKGAEVIARFLTERDAPVINEFTALPAQVAPLGTPVVLSWNVTYSGTDFALELTDNRGRTYDTAGKGLTDSLAVGSVSAATTFTLKVTTELFGEDEASASVGVGEGPRILTFTVGDATITSAAETTLNWSVENADSVTLTTGSGTPETVPAAPPSPRTVGPDTTTTYTLTATKAGFDPVTATRTITVGTAPSFTTQLSATPTSINAGQQTTLAWVVTGATSLTLEKDPETGDTTTEPVTGTSEVESPTVTTTYTIIATNDFGTTRSTSVAVSVTALPLPTIGSFTATPADLPAGGGSVTLEWSGVTNATTLTVQRNNGPDIDVTGDPDNLRVVTQTVTTTYTLVAENATGPTTFTPSRTVTVAAAAPPPVISSFGVDGGDTSVLPGATVRFVWDVTGATSYSLEGFGPITGTPAFQDVVVSTTPGTYNYRLIASNGTVSTPSAIIPITVGLAPTITFTGNGAQAVTITAGESVVLEWSITDATGGTITDIGPVGATSPTSGLSVTPSSDITYTLSASNDFGPATSQSVIVTVNPPPIQAPTIESFTAPDTTFAVGGTASFTWNFGSSGGTPTTTNLVKTEGGSSINIPVTPATSTSATAPVTASSTDFSLSSSNPGGTGTSSNTVTITTGAKPVISNVQVSTPGIGSTDYSVSWDITGDGTITYVLLDPGGAEVGGITFVGNTFLFTPPVTGDYTLRGSNEFGDAAEAPGIGEATVPIL